MTSADTPDGVQKPRMDRTGWFFLPEPRPSAHTRLFCFSYAGGWPWEFRSWPAALADVEVHAICLPGRGGRANEPAATSLDELASALRTVMLPLLGKPYALFGHSFGALLAFEVAGELERHAAPAPRRVFVSGSAVPRTHAERAPLHVLPDAELLASIRALRATPDRALEDPGIRAITLEMVRADLKLAELHHSRTAPLSAPITAFFGSADASAPRDAVAEWRNHTRGCFESHGVEGDHFFIQAQTIHVLSAIQRGLA
jgi:medium-chain acyl-[acyl-carrier-protein] hydrolase